MKTYFHEIMGHVGYVLGSCFFLAEWGGEGEICEKWRSITFTGTIGSVNSVIFEISLKFANNNNTKHDLVIKN